MLDVVWATLLFGVLGAGYLLIRNWYHRSKLPPGPPGWPLLGNTFQIDPARPHVTLSNWADKYGDVFTIQNFGTPIVVCNSFEALWEMLVLKSNDFAGRPESYHLSYIHNMNSDIAMPDFSSSWLRRKKIFMTNVKMYGDGSQRLEDIMVDIIDDLIKGIEDTNQQPFDPQEHIQFVLANALSILLFGRKFNHDDPDFRDLLIYMEQGRKILAPSMISMVLDMFPWMRHLPIESCLQLSQFLNGFVKDWIPRQMQKKLENSMSDTPTCVSDGLAKQHQQDTQAGTKDALEWDHVIGMCENFIMGGMHTSTGAMYSLLAVLVTHPHIQSQAQAEIDQVVGERQPTRADREMMPYVQAMLEETMRYAVVVALSIPHKATVNSEICGIFIPKNTQIWPNIWHLCHDSDFWGDPWTFRPERFLDETKQFLPSDHPARKRVLTFGAGRRVCPGEVLAKNRIFLLVTSLLQKFTFKPASEHQKPPHDPRTYTTGIAVYPNPYQIRAVPRK